MCPLIKFLEKKFIKKAFRFMRFLKEHIFNADYHVLKKSD